MLFSKQKSVLGIDIGTTDIKIAQLRPQGDQFVLEAYGIVNTSFSIVNRDSTTAIEQTAQVIKNLIKKANVTSKKVVAALPSSAVFTSVIEMPQIPLSEMKSAVEFEAKKYVPLPLSEIALSWSIIEGKKTKITKDTNLGNLSAVSAKTKVLLTAVPNSIVDNYLKVFEKVGLEPMALEIESLSLIRSLTSEADGTILVIDIGGKTTTINLVEEGYLRLSKSLNMGGETITASIAQSLAVNASRAEQFKKDFGLSSKTTQVPQVMRPILDVVKNEVIHLINLFESRGEHINQILLTGASSKLPNITEYFSQLGKPVILKNPWSKIIYPANLKPIIEPLGPNLAIALGLAMRQI